MRAPALLLLVGAASPAAAERVTAETPLARGTIFVGASAGGMLAPDFQAISMTPAFGWFIADRVSLGTLASVTALSDGDATATLWSLAVEPAYHAPIVARVDAVLGMGVGTAWAKGLGGQLVIAPRLGVHVHVGDHGVIIPAFAFRYVTHGKRDDARPIDDALTQGVQLEVGYLVTW